MKKIIYLLSALTVIVGCTEEGDHYPVPRDANGNVILTDISSATTTGISTLDAEFSVTGYLPNAKSGDELTVECLQLQTPSGGSEQLLPLAGTQKKVTVGGDLKATVSYSRSEAKLNNVGDYVTVTFAGKTDYAVKRVTVEPAISTTKPKVGGKDGTEITIARNDETAYFYVTVEPKSGAYTGTLAAQRSSDETNWSNVPVSKEGAIFLVPVAGTDFPADREKLFYRFTAEKDGYTDVITTEATVQDPYFFFKRTATVNVKAGFNPITGSNVAETAGNAILVATETLTLQGGQAWLAAGGKIEFVPSTSALYTLNNSNDAIAAFEAGTKTTVAEPVAGEGIYIFKAVTGTNASQTYYGMIKIINVVPNASVTFEYRIGNLYSHLIAE
jgi:hypothetical protein